MNMAKRSSTSAQSKSATGKKATKPSAKKTADAAPEAKAKKPTKKAAGAKAKAAKSTPKKAAAKSSAAGKKKTPKRPKSTATAASGAAPTLPDLPAVDPAEHLGLVPPASTDLPPVKIAKRDLLAIERALQINRAQLTNDVDALTHNNLSHSGRDMAGDLSGYGFHMADVATDNFAREMELNIATNETDRLRLVEEALERMDDGTYGRCLECGSPVGVPRLKVIPYTRFCIRCAEEDEADRS